MFKGERQNGRSTPNKANAKVKEAFANLLENNLEGLQKDIDSLEAKDRLRFLIDLSAYVIPKLKAIEVTNEENVGVKSINVSILSAEEVKVIKDNLEKMY
jgi:hypothetical protein